MEVQARPVDLLKIIPKSARQIGLTGVANATFKNTYTGQTIPQVSFPKVVTNNRTGFQGDSVEFSPISRIGQAISEISAYAFASKDRQRQLDQQLKVAQIQAETQRNFFKSPAFLIGAGLVVLIIISFANTALRSK
tara:strand:- start:1841 stop:2248 length:408 start_codon:yes stop_codon:yes gene_type:complete